MMLLKNNIFLTILVLCFFLMAILMIFQRDDKNKDQEELLNWMKIEKELKKEIVSIKKELCGNLQSSIEQTIERNFEKKIEIEKQMKRKSESLLDTLNDVLTLKQSIAKLDEKGFIILPSNIKRILSKKNFFIFFHISKKKTKKKKLE